MNKKISTVMVFKKSADGNIEPISIDAAGGMDSVIEQIKKATPIPIDTIFGNKGNKDTNDNKGKKGNKGTNSNKGKKAIDSNKGNKDTNSKKTNIIRLNRLQFIFTYMTDDTLIDFLMNTDNDFTIYFANGRRVEIEIIGIYRTVECDCDYCRKVIINEDPTILDKMDNKSYIEIKLDDDILNIIAEKQFKILEIMANIIVPLPSSIPSYPTFLPPLVTIPPLEIIDLSV